MNDWLRIAFVNVYPFFAYCIFVYVAFKKKKMIYLSFLNTQHMIVTYIFRDNYSKPPLRFGPFAFYLPVV